MMAPFRPPYPAPRALRNVWALILAVGFLVVAVALIPPNDGDDAWIWAAGFMAAASSYLGIYLAPTHIAPRILALAFGTFATASRVTVLVFTPNELSVERLIVASAMWTSLAVVAAVAVVVTLPGEKAAARRRVL